MSKHRRIRDPRPTDPNWASDTIGSLSIFSIFSALGYMYLYRDEMMVVLVVCGGSILTMFAYFWIKLLIETVRERKLTSHPENHEIGVDR